VDSQSEWRTFSNDDGGGDDPNRVGSAVNPLYSDESLGTQIGRFDFNGN
jgi:transcription initiation factor TFIIB